MNFELLKEKARRIIHHREFMSDKELRLRGLTLGENCVVSTNKIDLGHAFLITIGDNTTLSDCRILAHDASTKNRLGYSKVGGVKIGSNCFIGADAIILPGVVIGDDCIVGAGSVVTKSIPRGSVVVGNPARIIGSSEDYIQRNISNMKTAPVYDSYWKEKTEAEKRKMKDELVDGVIGYDI